MVDHLSLPPLEAVRERGMEEDPKAFVGASWLDGRLCTDGQLLALCADDAVKFLGDVSVAEVSSVEWRARVAFFSKDYVRVRRV